MSDDIQAVVEGLFAAGVATITVKDFHRTGYNLLRRRIDPRVRLLQGYVNGPVPGFGVTPQAEAVMFVGLHAASGSDGFLAHTLTSRIKRLEVNGIPLPEVALFASSLASLTIRPIFFSGCPTACHQARTAIPGIETLAIDKSAGPNGFDAVAWRRGLARRAVAALANRRTDLHQPRGPFRASVVLRDGEPAARIWASRWRLDYQGDTIQLMATDLGDLYQQLIRLCYLTPVILRLLPFALPAYNLWGRLGLAWVKREVYKR